MLNTLNKILYFQISKNQDYSQFYHHIKVIKSHKLQWRMKNNKKWTKVQLKSISKILL